MRDKPVNFGAIADCQYCNQKSKGVRKYTLSKQKLTECVDHLNTMDLDFVVHLGDFIDKDFKSFDEVLPIYNKLQSPHHQVLGNHDFDVADELKKDVPSKMGMPAKYYDFKKHNWRFIILDGNDLSFHAYPKESAQYKEAEVYYKTNKIKSPKWNGAIGPVQISWIESLLKEAQSHDEKVILFCHFPVYPQDPHNLWNSAEIITLLEKYSCVKAYINGHNHKGNYALKNGVHYLTLKGMVDTEENSYATLLLNNQSISVQGYGREKNRSLSIDK
ncbi:metallophosphoesterase [Lentisphaera marina]|uniref:metallophosphoesterase n=1 Tax=Lentisphaera marina TaxID=1111041 RepID=UPI0023663CDC|nr:metallophosphoesterase [Lentisphaera marina]MDD7985397.1 metallophosphoesterase [Lentisphaera marina]